MDLSYFINYILNTLAWIVASIKVFITSHLGGYPKVTLNNEQYTVLRGIGEGGFAYVYLVRKTNSPDSTLYALKRIPIQLPEQEERVRNEINAHKSVEGCSKILKLIDYAIVKKRDGTSEGMLLLPYCANGSLQDLINETFKRTRKGLQFDLILKILIDICDGLEEFHKQEPCLAYRDLKPQNVALDSEKHAILMDLGSVSSARMTLSTRHDVLVLKDFVSETVTSTYRPPEFFEPLVDMKIDERTDIWSLGCTMFAMAYGESPYNGTHTSTLSQVVIPDDSTYDPNFNQLIKKCLEIDINKRITLPEVKSVIYGFINAQNFEPSAV